METAMRLHRAARLPQAEGLYRQVLRSEPHHFDALHLLGVVCYQNGRHAEAVDLIRRALEQDASAFPALNNLGLAYRALNDLGAARSCFEKAVALQPRYVDARRNLADVLQAQGDLDAAAAELRSVLSLKPDFVVAHFNLGNVFRLRHKLEDAISCYRNALSLDPGLAAAHFSLAKTYEELGRHAEALAGYEKALEIDPRLAEAHAAVGSMLQDQGLIDEALACFRKALSLKPDYVEARWQLVMSQLALAYGPGDDPEAFREAFARELRALDEWLDADRVREGFKGVGVQQPYYLAYHASDNRDLLSRYGSLCTRLMKHWQDEQRLAPAHRAFRHDATQRVRVGIVSAYVYNQSVWTAITRGWCEHLDRNRFAIHLFCPGKTVDDETAFARSRADSFLHGPKSLREWIDAIRSAELDVILYPEIGMDSTTLKLACMRLAPVQLAAWGHPQTTGLPTIDYYLSAEDFEPDDAEAHYTERLVKLPHIGCCYRPLRVRSEEVDLEALGIDPGSLLLVCAGTPYKYDPRHDELLVSMIRTKTCRANCSGGSNSLSAGTTWISRGTVHSPHVRRAKRSTASSSGQTSISTRSASRGSTPRCRRSNANCRSSRSRDGI
jgi:predicted O-linked N-acetylglucosamine transferase (SPINDLY family)